MRTEHFVSVARLVDGLGDTGCKSGSRHRVGTATAWELLRVVRARACSPSGDLVQAGIVSGSSRDRAERLTQRLEWVAMGYF